MEADVGETQERQLHEDFGELRTWIERLPPMVDRLYLSVPYGDPVLNFCIRPVSGNVVRSDYPIASGGSQDIYTGEWTGQEVRDWGRKQKNFLTNSFQL